MLRKLAVALALSLWAHCACATIAEVNEASGSASASSASISTSSTLNVASGNALVVFCAESTSTAAITVTDTAGNTFNAVISSSADSTHNTTIFYAKNATANAADTVTCHYSPNQTFVAVIAIQYSGVATAAPLDMSTQNTGTGTVGTTGTFNTTVPNEVIVVGGVWEGTPTFTAGTGYTIVGSTGGFVVLEHQITSSVQSGATASITASTSNAWMIVGLSLEAASQPANCNATRTLMGVGC